MAKKLTKNECAKALNGLYFSDRSDDRDDEFYNVLMELINEHFEFVDKLRAGEISDGYHTLNELYHHRAVLFSVICNQNKDIAWKSKLHSDGTMYDEMFIVGITTPQGQYSYHYDINLWSLFDVEELDKAPEYDGHLPKDIERLKSIL